MPSAASLRAWSASAPPASADSQASKKPRLDDRIGVDHDHGVPRKPERVLDTGLPCRGSSRLFVGTPFQDERARVARDARGRVGAPVCDHEHLVTDPEVGADGLERVRDHQLFVVRGHEHEEVHISGMRAPWYPVEDRRGRDEAEVQRGPHSRECDEAREDDEDRAHVDTSDATPSRDATSGATSGGIHSTTGRALPRGWPRPAPRCVRPRAAGEPGRDDSVSARSRAGPDPFGIEPDELVRAVGRGDGPFRVLAQRQARHAEDRRLLLHAAGVGEHERRVGLEPQEVEVADGIDDLQVRRDLGEPEIGHLRLGTRMRREHELHLRRDLVECAQDDTKEVGIVDERRDGAA